MRYYRLTRATPQECLATEDAWLDYCEAGKGTELLLFWEPAEYFVVVGYANRVRTEVDLEFCEAQAIPILRRCSGGGTVLQGPGCLNYSLILRADETGPCRSISSTNEFVMERHRAALSRLLGQLVTREGHTDLAIQGRKFSGNAQRRRRDYLLFHGSFLLNMNIEMIQQALLMPSKQPAYRGQREHTDFLVNLELTSHDVVGCLREAWDAVDEVESLPFDTIRQLASTKYVAREWNYRF